MFTAALLTIARTEKQPRCPSTDEWIKKLWYTNTHKYTHTHTSITWNTAVVELLSCVLLFATHGRLLCPRDSPGKNTGVGCQYWSECRGTSGLKPCPLWLLHGRWVLYLGVSQSLRKCMSIESVMPSNHPILCCPRPALPSIFPSIKVFSNESTLRIRLPKYWSFSFSISPSNEHLGLISFQIH